MSTKTIRIFFIIALVIATTHWSMAGAQDSSDAGKLSIGLGDGGRIDDDEVVTFFPSYGYFDATAGQWVLNIQGWIREPDDAEKFRSLIKAGFESLAEEKIRDENDFWRRIRPLAADNERGERVLIKLGGRVHETPPSTRGGRITGQIRLSRGAADRLKDEQGWISYEAAAKNGRVFHGKIQLIPPTGHSVISDIDDTIKLSEIYKNTAWVLRNTFNREPTACPGMAALYRKLRRESDASFHYLSGSPWQLFEFLDAFRADNDFPDGSFSMKEFRMNPASPEFWSLISSGGTIKQKKAAIKAALESFPGRQFTLIGDSGEHDPEIYG
ncbi:MAG: DUF2183 domain-containing protein, partial [Desulfobacterales bacterium]|nr:DUF2183 domain-containing protein [Desulfobacterales bacterium]